MEVTIDGINYQVRPKKPTKPVSQSIQKLLAMGAVYGLVAQGNVGGRNDYSEPDFEYYAKEYELIKLKQSKLPRAKREYIVKRFNQLFIIKE